MSSGGLKALTRRAAASSVRELRVATAAGRALPDFLIIGAQKAGTTSLYAYLTDGRDVRSASTKEIHYFDHHHDRGENWYRGQFPWGRDGRRWMTGEATPSYLLNPSVPHRVADLLPDVRLIALLRNPVERAYSHFQHSRARGTEPLPDFERALDLEAERTTRAWTSMTRGEGRQPDAEMFSYVRRGLYAPQLLRWLEVVDRSSLLVLTAEELFADPGHVVDRVRAHIGLPPAESTSTFATRNGRSYEQLPDRIRERLADLFRDDVAEVERILGRPTGWRL